MQNEKSVLNKRRSNRDIKHVSMNQIVRFHDSGLNRGFANDFSHFVVKLDNKLGTPIDSKNYTFDKSCF